MVESVKLGFFEQLRERIDSKNGLIQVLLGPRQVGKTTTVLKLIEAHYPKESLYESSDRVFNASPEWLVEVWTRAQASGKILFIDEVQKCENWAEVIKMLFDRARREKQPVRCVLLGSSSLEIQKGLTESLTGRIQLVRAYHWNASESKEGYGVDFETYLKVGGYPGSYGMVKNLKDWADYLKHSIISTVIEKDILQYQTVKSPALFRQAFEILMSYPAQEISYTKLLGQLQDRGNVELIKNYLHLYEGAFLVKALEKFSNRKMTRKSSSPKILPMAPCLFYSGHLGEYDSDERGRVFEAIVGNQLVRTGYDLSYWRDGNHEIDFVVQKGKKIWAVEVKSGRRKRVSGWLEFNKRFKQAVLVVIDAKNYETFERDPVAYLEQL